MTKIEKRTRNHKLIKELRELADEVYMDSQQPSQKTLYEYLTRAADEIENNS